jgi:hypothetical protein
MRCTFCATGKGGFARNLQAHEIIDQVLTVGEAFGQRPTNVGEFDDGQGRTSSLLSRLCIVWSVNCRWVVGACGLYP